MKKAAEDHNKLIEPYNQAKAQAKLQNKTTTPELVQAMENLKKAREAYDKVVKEMEDKGLSKTMVNLKGTFGLRTVN